MSDLVQITNPPSGYMHNCNVTPFGMMKDSPLVPEKYAPYIYNASRTAPRHQRAEMMTDLLDAANKVTLEDAINIAFSPQVYHAELWQARLKAAWTKAGGSLSASSVSSDAASGRPGVTADAVEVFDLIQNWNRKSDADSEGALAYYAFKRALGPELGRQVEVPADITDDQLTAAVGKASEWLKSTFGSLHVPYGRYFRVGRQSGDRTFPVGGGSLNGGANNVAMATPRAISFGPVGKEMVGAGGQTSTQIVVMTNPPKSYAIIPLGESDHKESGHWDDQAEKLFSKSKAAPTFFLDKNELMKHVTAKKVLKRAAAAQAGR